MKKVVLSLLAALLVLSCSAAAPAVASPSGAAYKRIIAQINDLDYTDLVKLRDLIDARLEKLKPQDTEAPREVTVPAGVYKIGVDIPAGYWTIRADGAMNISTVYYFQKPDESGLAPDPFYPFYFYQVASPDMCAYASSLTESVDIDMADSWYFSCDTAVVFSVFTGKPNLGF